MRNHFSPTVICGFIHPHLQTSFLPSKNYYVSSKYQFITIHMLHGTPFTYIVKDDHDQLSVGIHNVIQTMYIRTCSYYVRVMYMYRCTTLYCSW